MSEDPVPDLPRRIRPVECFRAGYQLIKDDFWLFVGVSLVGMLIASAVPLGILLGPMMCGIYLCLLRKDRGRPVKFEILFKGFDYFLPSLIATLIMVVPMLVIMLGGYAIFFAAIIAQAPPPGGQPDPDFGRTILGGMGIFYAVVILISVVVSVLFFFTYPLIVDRGLSGTQAIKTSMRAATGNLGGVLGVVLLSMLFSLVGTLACCVGWIFVMPIHFAAVIVAYRQAFPELDQSDEIRDEPARLEGEDFTGDDPSP